MNAVLLEKTECWLTELGFKTERADTVLKVNRDSIANWPTDSLSLLDELKREFGPRLFWSEKDDNWLYLEGY